MRSIPAAGFALACFALPQTDPALPAFDAASINPAAPQASVDKSPAQPVLSITPGTVRILNATLRSMIVAAYGIRDYQVAGPASLGSERYDVIAKSENAAPEAQLRLMLRRLLTERFNLAFHREAKQMNTFVLSQSKAAGKLQPGDPAGHASVHVDAGRIVFENFSVAGLADYLTRAGDRPVLDDTGLEGVFDFSAQVAQSNNPVDVKIAMRDAIGDGSLAQMIAEQNGLRLESRKRPVEIFVIDRAERPSAN